MGKLKCGLAAHGSSSFFLRHFASSVKVLNVYPQKPNHEYDHALTNRVMCVFNSVFSTYTIIYFSLMRNKDSGLQRHQRNKKNFLNVTFETYKQKIKTSLLIKRQYLLTRSKNTPPIKTLSFIQKSSGCYLHSPECYKPRK